MRNNQLQQILNDLNGSTADIEASALISTDGLMMASALPQGMDEDRVGAMTAALLSLGDRAAQRTGPWVIATYFVAR
jgi:predicted regulator of Ras-like GTPase activity (Roadblock/LC7/MglB family)